MRWNIESPTIQHTSNQVHNIISIFRFYYRFHNSLDSLFLRGKKYVVQHLTLNRLRSPALLFTWCRKLRCRLTEKNWKCVQFICDWPNWQRDRKLFLSEKKSVENICRHEYRMSLVLTKCYDLFQCMSIDTTYFFFPQKKRIQWIMKTVIIHWIRFFCGKKNVVSTDIHWNKS